MTEVKKVILFKIGQDIQALSQLLDDTDGEITPDIESSIDSWLKEMGDKQGDKLDSYIAVIRNAELEQKLIESYEKAAKEEVERFTIQKNKRKRLVDQLKDSIKRYMEFLKVKSLITSKLREIKIVNNGGAVGVSLKYQNVTDLDENGNLVDTGFPDYEAYMKNLPEVFKKVKESVDEDALKQYLQSDDKEKVALASKYAMMETRGTRVSIK